ncbi:type I-F CRISPR-associated helicase Cas3f [Acinetobacter indicus]|uniref:type I-F CRISPR-associated helicase Cas3f n=1 Tax=Acinetobacter indicus TaxID=756892 RepID=UPI001443A6A8|nr:type I-F CRISPR-associated helicase Cas3f [Acinetobacter indicus]
MIVTFISQCEKKAIPRTRRVLDAFADRIGDNTWQTVITEDGLMAVKKLLRKTVTKNTAVSCHWIRGRRRSELLWIVGNRNKFNGEGVVPVNTTQKKLDQNKWENDWHYLPLIKALVAISALLHDWGKATVLFQEKLQPKNKQGIKGDPLRHEWISCLLLNALVHSSENPKNDEAWLNFFIHQSWDEDKLKATVLKNLDKTKALDHLPPLAQLVAWLIVSHHRLPTLKSKDENKKSKDYLEDFIDEDVRSFSSLFSYIQAEWGYQNKFDEKEYQQRLKQCFEFPQGLLSQSQSWKKEIQKWSRRLLQEQENIAQVLKDGSWRVVLHHARLCLMLGDHYYSSCDADKTWKTNLSLIANTDHKTKQPKQFLDEHLVHVSKNAMRVAQSLSRLADEMEPAYDIQKLKKKSPQGFEWQDHAVKEIKQFRQKCDDNIEQGWFIVNMASTGKGKTIANAKIMQALSKDGQSLRYVLALGLRTLTLQTGDSYRKDIGLSNDELAVLIGSKAVQELHQQQHQKQKNQDENPLDEIGSESLEQLLDNELDYAEMPQADFMNVLFPQAQAERNKAFLYKPVLVCTIDHIMSATETKRGGKYILPCLRLSSSDLVIDEVDDFNGQDLIAIARLIHLTAMLGRKVMISSATIPPALAEGFFNVYQQGWRLYCAFKKLKQVQTVGMWVDEFKSKTQCIDLTSDKTIQQYKHGHDAFVTIRSKALAEQVIKHKAYIIECHDLVAQKEQKQLEESLQQQYFDRIRQHIEKLHHHHHTIDEKTGKKVSFGVVRVANIPPCVALTQFLLNGEWSEKIAPRAMAYHSRQVLLLRSEQEHHLDAVLKRKEKQHEQPIAFSNEIIRQHLDSTDSEHVIFILVATPVEEVGRDHDFDWAIVEPSSYRSIIQLAGRVLRHRRLEKDIEQPNIGLLQYNLKGLCGAKVAFEKPGFEINNDKFKLKTKNLSDLIDLSKDAGINAIPRIQANTPLKATEKLADLEHAVLAHSLTNYKQVGAKPLNAWLTQYWFLTALPQRFTPFRQSSPNIQLFAVWQDRKLVFSEKDDFGQYRDRSEAYNISYPKLTELAQKRLWLNRNYSDILSHIASKKVLENQNIEDEMEKLSKRYGEIMLPQYVENKTLMYSDQFGLVVQNSN